jgi:hypothetical protein
MHALLRLCTHTRVFISKEDFDALKASLPAKDSRATNDPKVSAWKSAVLGSVLPC